MVRMDEIRGEERSPKERIGEETREERRGDKGGRKEIRGEKVKGRPDESHYIDPDRRIRTFRVIKWSFTV